MFALYSRSSASWRIHLAKLQVKMSSWIGHFLTESVHLLSRPLKKTPSPSSHSFEHLADEIRALGTQKRGIESCQGPKEKSEEKTALSQPHF